MWGPMTQRRWPLFVVGIACLFGVVFSGFSTNDFVKHLDRQTHSIHCSFVPGLDTAAAAGTGCHVTLMSPYSAVLRAKIWGGLPISLPAVSVFSFLLFWTVMLVSTHRDQDKRASGFLLLGTLLPVGASLVMAYISFSTLGAACKMCIGIYISSLVAALAALYHWRSTDDADSELTQRGLAVWFGVGVLFVLVPAVAYAAGAPAHEKYIGTCGELAQQSFADDIAVALPTPGAASSVGQTPVIEVLDPLCPSCKGLETRLIASGLASQMSRRAVLFPLDKSCNWMVDSTLHPGACTLSEAILCAGPQAPAVLAWSYEHQDEITTATKADPEAAKRMVTRQFPSLASCIGSPAAKQKVNRSLRWAVTNHIRVLTPQIFVAGKKLCDEDTDLGLDYTLSRMLATGARP